MVALLILASLNPILPQDAPRPGTITVTAPDLAKPILVAPEELAKLPRTKLRVTHPGIESEFEGVTVAEVLKHAQVPLGEALRGRALAVQVLIATAADGQKAVYALAEIDSSFSSGTVLLADRMNGKPLSAEEGPWRLVVSGDKRRARSLRQVVSLTLKKL